MVRNIFASSKEHGGTWGFDFLMFEIKKVVLQLAIANNFMVQTNVLQELQMLLYPHLPQQRKCSHLPFIISLNFSSKSEKMKLISRGLFTKDWTEIQIVPSVRNKVMLLYQRYFGVQPWAQES